MRAVVTGAAGFIGSTLTDRLLGLGTSVVAIDSFTPYYAEELKRGNLRPAAADPRFRLVEADLATGPLEDLFGGADVVVHLAGQPGVRRSWEDRLGTYLRDNVLATQRVLEAARCVAVPRVVYASSSSVYGNAPLFPCHED